jgi:hypothetical protein
MAPRNAYPACPVGSGNPTGVNSFSACLLAKNDRIGGDRLDLLNRGHAIPLGFTPWNESCPGEHLSFGSFAIPLAQNLSHRSHAIPLGPTPCNACPVKCRSDFTGVESFLFLSGSMPHALCSMLAVLLGLGNALSRFYIKSSISSEGGWSFFMSTLVNDTCC